MSEKLFKSLVKCGICGKHMVYISQNTLLCNNYKRNGGCEYHTTKQDTLLNIITQHANTYGMNLTLTNEFMKIYINSISIKSNGIYEIIYNNGEHSSWNGHQLRI